MACRGEWLTQNSNSQLTPSTIHAKPQSPPWQGIFCLKKGSRAPRGKAERALVQNDAPLVLRRKGLGTFAQLSAAELNAQKNIYPESSRWPGHFPAAPCPNWKTPLWDEIQARHTSEWIL